MNSGSEQQRCGLKYCKMVHVAIKKTEWLIQRHFPHMGNLHSKVKGMLPFKSPASVCQVIGYNSNISACGHCIQWQQGLQQLSLNLEYQYTQKSFVVC